MTYRSNKLISIVCSLTLHHTFLITYLSWQSYVNCNKIESVNNVLVSRCCPLSENTKTSSFEGTLTIYPLSESDIWFWCEVYNDRLIFLWNVPSIRRTIKASGSLTSRLKHVSWNIDCEFKFLYHTLAFNRSL